MDQADSVHSTPPTNTSAPLERPAEPAQGLETGLAVQQRERERALRKLTRLRKKASAEIERLLAFLDQSDEYVMTERELEEEGDDADHEPALGAFDRMTDQDRAWRTVQGEFIAGTDAEVDDCDREDDDPDEARDQPPA